MLRTCTPMTSRMVACAAGDGATGGTAPSAGGRSPSSTRTQAATEAAVASRL